MLGSEFSEEKKAKYCFNLSTWNEMKTFYKWPYILYSWLWFAPHWPISFTGETKRLMKEHWWMVSDGNSLRLSAYWSAKTNWSLLSSFQKSFLFIDLFFYCTIFGAIPHQHRVYFFLINFPLIVSHQIYMVLICIKKSVCCIQLSYLR